MFCLIWWEARVIKDLIQRRTEWNCGPDDSYWPASLKKFGNTESLLDFYTDCNGICVNGLNLIMHALNKQWAFDEWNQILWTESKLEVFGSKASTSVWIPLRG